MVEGYTLLLYFTLYILLNPEPHRHSVMIKLIVIYGVVLWFSLTKVKSTVDHRNLIEQ